MEGHLAEPRGVKRGAMMRTITRRLSIYCGQRACEDGYLLLCLVRPFQRSKRAVVKVLGWIELILRNRTLNIDLVILKEMCSLGARFCTLNSWSKKCKGEWSGHRIEVVRPVDLEGNLKALEHPDCPKAGI